MENGDMRGVDIVLEHFFFKMVLKSKQFLQNISIQVNMITDFIKQRINIDHLPSFFFNSSAHHDHPYRYLRNFPMFHLV